jgi:ERAP1-like C-terminal domain
LKSDIDLLSSSDRAGLVSDLFAMVETSRICPSKNISTWLDSNLGFLAKEKSTSVWSLVLQSLQHFLLNIDSQDAKVWFSVLIGSIVKEFSWTLPAEPAGLASIRHELFAAAVLIGEPSVLQLCSLYFASLVSGTHTDLHPSLVDIVYDSTIRWGSNTEFGLLQDSCRVNFSVEKLVGLVSSSDQAFQALSDFKDKLRPQEVEVIARHMLKSSTGAEALWKYLKTLGTFNMGARWAAITEECVSLLSDESDISQAQSLDVMAIKRGLERNVALRKRAPRFCQ